MKHNLLYINEQDFTSALEIKLNKLNIDKNSFHVIVQLKGVKKSTVPMINNLTDIRREKAMRKITHWFTSYCYSIFPESIFICETTEKLIDIILPFEEVKEVKVFCLNKNNLRKLLLFSKTHPQTRFDFLILD